MNTTTTKKTKRKVRYYSTQEMNELAPFIKNGVTPSEKNLKEFCEKHQRPYCGVQVLIYKLRRSNGNTRKSTLIKTIKQTAMVSKNEFVIPISKWEIRTEDGVTNLILKFN